MTLACVAMAFLLGRQAAQAPAKAPDRSGEAAFKQILSWAKGLDNRHIVIFKESRGSAKEIMYPESRVDIWLSGSSFRLETSGYWGEGSTVICDGKSVLSDSGSEWEPATVTEAKANLVATCADVKQPTEEISPFFGFLAGPENLDKLVGKSAPITAGPTSGGEKSISYASKKYGSVNLYYHVAGNAYALDRIDFDNMPALMDLMKADPDWDGPEPGGLSRHHILLGPDRPSSGMFAISPPKGREVADKRKKKG